MRLKDRFLLAATAGIAGNVAKHITSSAFKKAKWLDVDGPEKAAGMLIPAHQIREPLGRVVGYFADAVIGGLGGLMIVYTLSVTGPNPAVLKGAMMGQGIWTLMYGALSQAAITKVPTTSAKGALAEMAGHTVFGAVVGGVAVALADPGLFKQPLLSSPVYSIDSPQASAQTIGKTACSRGFRVTVRPRAARG